MFLNCIPSVSCRTWFSGFLVLYCRQGNFGFFGTLLETRCLSLISGAQLEPGFRVFCIGLSLEPGFVGFRVLYWNQVFRFSGTLLQPGFSDFVVLGFCYSTRTSFSGLLVLYWNQVFWFSGTKFQVFWYTNRTWFSRFLVLTRFLGFLVLY